MMFNVPADDRSAAAAEEGHAVQTPPHPESNGHRISSVREVLERLDGEVRSGHLDALRAIPTGFTPLDGFLHGGIHPGELLMLGGAQGLGKTTWALQMARHVAAGGRGRVLYLCYEHEQEFLLERLIAMESALGGDEDPISMGSLRDLFAGRARQEQDGLLALLGQLGAIRPTLKRIHTYEDRLFLVRANAHTTVERIGDLVRACPGQGPLVVVVDYLQKVAVRPEPEAEEDKVRRAVEGLKELAMSEAVGVVAIAASDVEGLKAQRMRIQHLRGGSSLMYEADVILIMNDKYKAVARHHVVYQPSIAEGFHNWVVFTLEKNRGGVDLIDFELRKRFPHACFHPTGGFVAEQLVDGRLYLT
jgi:replicative DNA helicase